MHVIKDFIELLLIFQVKYQRKGLKTEHKESNKLILYV